MSFNKDQFLDLIIRPALDDLCMDSLEARELLLGTCAQESLFGTYLKQMGNGPALGVYDMERRTYFDTWSNYLKFRPQLAVLTTCHNNSPYSGMLTPDCLISDLIYATKMARIHYYRVSAPIPKDLEGQAHYWKKHYNTDLGKGTVEEYIDNYRRYVDAER